MSPILMQPRHILATILSTASILLSAQCPVAASQLTLSWIDDSTDESGFAIERKTGMKGTYEQIATTAANVASSVDPTVDAGVSYYYRVQSFNTGEGSLYANEACGSTPLPTSLPTSPPPEIIGLTRRFTST